MAKYIKKFETESGYNSYIGGSDVALPNVSLIVPDDVRYNPIPSGPDANGHEYVDLGLPSGKLWATMNIGASFPEDYGNYYAWGELSGKSDYSWNTYRFGSALPFSKYDTDGLTTLELVDDVARAEWGGDWRMPTQADLQELIDNTDSIVVDPNSGTRMFRGFNGNSIIIPAAGYCFGTSMDYVGTLCYLWGSSLTPSNHNNAINLNFHSGGISMNNNERCNGFSVRGVLY